MRLQPRHLLPPTPRASPVHARRRQRGRPERERLSPRVAPPYHLSLPSLPPLPSLSLFVLRGRAPCPALRRLVVPFVLRVLLLAALPRLRRAAGPCLSVLPVDAAVSLALPPRLAACRASVVAISCVAACSCVPWTRSPSLLTVGLALARVASALLLLVARACVNPAPPVRPPAAPGPHRLPCRVSSQRVR